ncbi:MAG: META domain-containing protein [Cyclobacteriaceae bacterium]|nr:META domain-containing protein [Cyclobacteriaceae bacterium]
MQSRFFGGYTLSGRVITFSNLGATKMFCQDAMPLEDAFLKLLSTERRALFSDSRLDLDRRRWEPDDFQIQIDSIVGKGLLFLKYSNHNRDECNLTFTTAQTAFPH